MKPTEQQDILLRKYLRDTLRYRETYEEVYDHILTALEHNNYTGTLEEVVNEILREDFGGYDKLKQMETAAKRVALADGVSKFMRFFISYFRLPRVFYTLIAAVLIYFSLGQIRMAPIMFEVVFGVIILTPAILSLRRYYIVGYLFRDTKKSIRDDVFGRISMIPTRLFVILGIGITINFDKGHNIFDNSTPVVLTTLYVLSAIYLLSIIRLYRDEFKMSMTA